MKLFTRTSVILASAWAVQVGYSHASPTIRNVYTFPRNTFIENIAVQSNGNILVTSLGSPSLFSIDPTVPNPNASIIATFPNATGISGVTEIEPDVFAVVTGVWDQAITRAALGTLAVWTVDFSRGPVPSTKYITGIANSTIFNGIARHPTNPRLLLAADSAAGAVYRVDLGTGLYGVAFSSPLLQPTGTAAEGKHLGINGLKAARSTVYFTNSAQGLFGKVGIDFHGNQVGGIEVLAKSSAAGSDVVYDDFALDLKRGTAWIASHPSYGVGVSLLDGRQTVINDTTKLLNPTSAAFGRGGIRQQKTLYVTNGGQFTPEFDLVNAGVVAVELLF
ncbi:hypothetical protein DL546_000841 [Coniochaeta pulveracea]|uniref:SMP-30/Gluconolactonase/LRE-like region domain-containing protein n=1 Tax=Coniochaeta pulveracea TaxID=177199 RepID=A0A420YLF9_9PEZI|nr:hypothetical protein DL546_000841 [Coniochaeta pulveracea]